MLTFIFGSIIGCLGTVVILSLMAAGKRGDRFLQEATYLNENNKPTLEH